MLRIGCWLLGMVLSGNVLADNIRLRADAWYPVNGAPAAARAGIRH
jgi:hypothetical protein